MSHTSKIILLFLMLSTATCYAQETKQARKTISTKHSMLLNGKPFRYHATRGQLPITNKAGMTVAVMSYIAYTKDDAKPHRPLTFLYDGGPGDSSIYINFFGTGPKTVDLKGGDVKHSKIVDNQDTWLASSDLVYVDAVGTGWSRLINQRDAKSIYTTIGDATVFSQFISKFMTKAQHQDRPLYVGGVSYAGFRSALVTQRLMRDYQIKIQGIIDISPLLDFKTVVQSFANNFAYVLFIPSYTRVALYHHKLGKAEQQQPEKTIAAARHWALTAYQRDLFLGDSLPQDERNKLVDMMAKYTGLDKQVIINNHYRVSRVNFERELLRTKKQLLYMLDGRYTYPQQLVQNPEENDLLLKHAKWASEIVLPYMQEHLDINDVASYKLHANVQDHWDWRVIPGAPVAPEVLSVMRDFITKDPKMKVFVGIGFYDMDVPHLGSIRNVRQLLLQNKRNITVRSYPSGHHVYWDMQSRAMLAKDIRQFYK